MVHKLSSLGKLEENNWSKENKYSNVHKKPKNCFIFRNMLNSYCIHAPQEYRNHNSHLKMETHCSGLNPYRMILKNVSSERFIKFISVSQSSLNNASLINDNARKSERLFLSPNCKHTKSKRQHSSKLWLNLCL